VIVDVSVGVRGALSFHGGGGSCGWCGDVPTYEVVLLGRDKGFAVALSDTVAGPCLSTNLHLLLTDATDEVPFLADFTAEILLFVVSTADFFLLAYIG
jgi:hypothetical protein